jgi:hypothetical protein
VNRKHRGGIAVADLSEQSATYSNYNSKIANKAASMAIHEVRLSIFDDSSNRAYQRPPMTILLYSKLNNVR